MKIDILFPTYHRSEFTAASIRALLRNTNLRGRIVVDNDEGRNSGPVAAMNRLLAQPGTEIFAKIDNDTIVPPGWLEQCVAVMEAHPELDLLGIEPPASRTPAPWGRKMSDPESRTTASAGYARCEMIGGIGLFRRRAFEGRAPMRPREKNGVGGFSDWQTNHPAVVKGWIVPPLNVFLLDRLPIEPWASLSKTYIAKGWQRPWTNYKPQDHGLWDWWLEQERKAA